MSDLSCWYLQDNNRACGLINKPAEQMIQKFESLYQIKYTRYEKDFPHEKFCNTGCYYDTQYLTSCGLLLDDNSNNKYYYLPEGPFPMIIELKGFDGICILIAPRIPIPSNNHI